MRLLLGEPGSEDFYTCEISHPRGKSLKTARQKLAAMALDDLMDNPSDHTDDSEGDVDDDDDGLGITSSGYEWEIHHTVDGKVDTYLYGLLWNIQTYQDGVCSDYSYNYGKRLSPMANEIVTFFEKAKQENRKVGPRELRQAPFSPPVSAGVSCLAALPSPVKSLVPEPYRSIPDEVVEAFYGTCMDPEDNVFDMKRFEKLCKEEVRSLQSAIDARSNERNDDSGAKQPSHDGRRILMGDHYWTVVSKVPKPLPHPFDPPEPFSERLSKLRPNNRIRVSRLIALAEPRPRSAWKDKSSPPRDEPEHLGAFVDHEALEIIHSDPGPFLTSLATVDQVDYRVAYQKSQKQVRRGLRKGKVKLSLQAQKSATPQGGVNGEQSKDSMKHATAALLLPLPLP